MRFGHQIHTDEGRMGGRRHIPNPSVSVRTLKQAAAAWVGGWDEEIDDDFEDESGESPGGLHELSVRVGERDEHGEGRGLGEYGAGAGVWPNRFGGTLTVLAEGEEGTHEGTSIAGIASESEMRMEGTR